MGGALSIERGIVVKTLTRHPRPGNLRWWKPWSCIRLIPGGSVNEIGLTNPGIDWWCQHIGPRLDYGRMHIVGSIFGDEQELIEMAEMLNRFDLVAVEVNPSCPNTGHKLFGTDEVIAGVEVVKRVSRHPVIVKVSVDQDYLAIAYCLESVAEAIAFNSVPWKTAFPNGERNPLHKIEEGLGGGGGVSGRPAQKQNWAAVKELSEQRKLPVIAPSIMGFDDLARVRALGASAVSFGAIHLLKPWAPTSIVERDMRQYSK